MSRYKSKIHYSEGEAERPLLPSQGKSFLELLLNESAGEAFPEDSDEENFAEIAIPNRFNKKKHLNFLRFPKLKEMLDNLSHAEPEKPDGYVILDENTSLKAVEMQEIQQEAAERDDTEEFLNNIEDKLKIFGKIGRKLNQSGKSAALAEDEAAYEAGIVRSIIQDEKIISETLADLLAAQGQTLKAIKMYQSLCLKLPKKSVYFAKKIDKLR